MNSGSPRKTLSKSLGLSCRQPVGLAKIFRILERCDQLVDQARFRQEINLKHQKKTRAQLFNKWKGRV